MKTHPVPLLLLLVVLCSSCGRPQEASAQAPAKPRAHEEVLKLVDFSSFPKVEGATRQSSDVLNASFSVQKKDDGTVKTLVEVMETFLMTQGWKLAVVTMPWTAEGGMSYYQKEGVMIQANAGVTPGFQNHPPEVNAGLFLSGEVDARTLPMPPDSKVEHSDFSFCRYKAPLEELAIHEFNQDKLCELGWLVYRDPLLASIENTQEQMLKTQTFVQNGATLSFRLERKDNQTEVSVNTGLLSVSLPIMSGPDLLKVRDDPPLVSYFVKGTPADVLAWHTDALGKLGWSGKEVPATEERTTRHEFQKSGNKPLYLVCLPSKDQTIVQLRE